MIENKRPFIYLPIIFALIFIGGIYLGLRLSNGKEDSKSFSLKLNRFNKINEIINYIEQEYVDSVDRSDLENSVISQLLQDLDPHSYYISPKELAAMNEPLIGNFEGIGVEFSIQKDTIVVLAPVVGGPSELLGIKAGDRIVQVDTINVAGNGVTNSRVMELLRGEKGSKVTVKIFRNGQKKLLSFTIERDKIPIYSIDVSYLLKPTIGYLKLSRFSKTTHEEFVKAAAELKSKGMKEIILDLRGNGGGYLDAAIDLADEFLEDGKLIVYTEGKARPKKLHYATNKGNYNDLKLTVLIDEGSASASEIIAGAIQDNDRGNIIGRRSFGKGLVQEQSDWPDGSAVRLTIARYYTPTGRCIQRSYADGTKKYYEEAYEEIGSLDETEQIPDSSIADSLKFRTPAGKIVYGGGGITPDIYVAVDTFGGSLYLSELNYNGIIRNFAFEFTDKNRDALYSYKTVESFVNDYSISENLLKQLYDYAEKSGIVFRLLEAKHSESRIKIILKANVAKHLWHNEGFYRVISEQDPMLKVTLNLENN